MFLVLIASILFETEKRREEERVKTEKECVYDVDDGGEGVFACVYMCECEYLSICM